MSGRDGKEALSMELIKPEQKYLQYYYEACLETWGYVHDSYIHNNPNMVKLINKIVAIITTANKIIFSIK